MIGAIGFTTPWLLLALAALPILWIILRAIPPAPIRRIFPGVALLLGLTDDAQVSDRTPWWLLLLRSIALASIIIGLAGPVLNPKTTPSSNAPLLVVMDASWASAPDWPARMGALDEIFADAARANRRAALLDLSRPEPTRFQTASDLQSRIPGLTPAPWHPTMDRKAAEPLLPDGDFETMWFSDGLQRAERADLLQLLETRGPVQIIQTPRPISALAPLAFEDGALVVTAKRTSAPAPYTLPVALHGKDPAGISRVLATTELVFEQGATTATSTLSLPAELRARITHARAPGLRSAATVTLTDDALRRREVALIAGRDDREGLELLDPLHYLRQALITNTDLLEGPLTDILPAAPDVIILADVAKLTPAEQADLLDWTENGGLLVRFAGPRLAASDISRGTEDALMPVRLRAGGRTVGGAMSWGTTKSLAPFDPDSPFFGLALPGEVAVSSQVMAEPDPTLASRVIAGLSDGTPLVTRKPLGQGQVVLFHVTANAEWSNLPLSGLFVSMLDRLAVSSSGLGPDASDLSGTTWKPVRVLDGFGRLSDASALPGVAGNTLLEGTLGPDLRPGLYSENARSIARNVISQDTEITPEKWPPGTDVRTLTITPETPLGGLLLALALALLLVDAVATLTLSGRLRTAATMIASVALLGPALEVQAQEPVSLASDVVLAHVLTRDRAVDDTAKAGLRGLSNALTFRTSVEPADPKGVDLERDELAFFPLIYWPVTPNQPVPSTEAYAKLNAYLRSGGLILFDTRDANVAGFGAASPTGRKLQQLAAPLDIPPLEPVPDDHVLTRTFYLLQDFPGRHVGQPVWVEAAPKDAQRIEGMPFRNLNDGVTPVVIGGNDWASAWATDPRGNQMFPVGRGYAGERQRELAYRFGVNLVMHVLTGNYKSDQVHVPALLDRLGQ